LKKFSKLWQKNSFMDYFKETRLINKEAKKFILDEFTTKEKENVNRKAI